jgi:hypothetical protein
VEEDGPEAPLLFSAREDSGSPEEEKATSREDLELKLNALQIERDDLETLLTKAEGTIEGYEEQLEEAKEKLAAVGEQLKERSYKKDAIISVEHDKAQAFMEESAMGRDFFGPCVRRLPDGLMCARREEATGTGNLEGLPVEVEESYKCFPCVNVCFILLLMLVYLLISGVYVLDASNPRYQLVENEKMNPKLRKNGCGTIVDPNECDVSPYCKWDFTGAKGTCLNSVCSTITEQQTCDTTTDCKWLSVRSDVVDPPRCRNSARTMWQFMRDTGFFGREMYDFFPTKVFLIWNVVIIFTLCVNASGCITADPITGGKSMFSTREPGESHIEELVFLFGKFRRYIFARELSFSLFVALCMYVLYLVVADQERMVYAQESIFTTIYTPSEKHLKNHEIIAICVHGVALMLGLTLVHNSDYASKCFLKLGYAIRMQELDESEKEPPKGTMIKYKDLEGYAEQLKNTWHSAISIIDLVDITDFYLLLFESDLYNPDASESMEGQLYIENVVAKRIEQRGSSSFGLCDWEKIRLMWLIAFFAAMFGSLFDKVLLTFLQKINRSSWARWSELPDGMTFWGLYTAKREMEKGLKEEQGLSITGPYPSAWRSVKEYYEFNLPRKKNQQAFISAVRSLIFVETPFLYWRLHCSTEYNIVASSLMIKNVVSLVYDFYIVCWGLWRLYIIIWFRECCAPYGFADTAVRELEERDEEQGKSQQQLQRRTTRIMGAKSWLTTEQLMSQPGNRGAYLEYLQTGVFPSYLYSPEIYGENILEVAEDEVVSFLESTGMAA